ncbi:hypothetical protein F2Q68_00042618, partial [Brassica cretica]
MEEKAAMDFSSDCGDSQVEPRVGDEFQAKITPLMSASRRASFLSTPAALNDSSFPFLVGQPLQVTWIDKHPKQQGSEDDDDDDDDDDVDMNQSLKSLIAKRKRRSRYSDKHSVSKKQRLSLEPLPEIQSIPWEDLDVASLVLGLYTFGKNFAQLKSFMESKGTGEIVLFYYGKFYNSARYNSWSHSRKKRNRRCVFGRKLYSGWRQQQLLSRLIPSVSNESQRQMLVNVSKSFSEGNITLEKYVSTVKGLVGLRLLLKGTSRLSKARCNDIFWEAVWLRLLARGWRSEQPKYHRRYNIVFIIPGVKQFSRGELVKGDQYFDSVSDILTKVASEPELLDVLNQNSSPEERRTVHELISSEQEPNGLCSVSDSEQKRTTNDLKQAPSILSSNTSPSNDLGTTQELGSSEQQQTNTDAPRRQSTRKRPLTTRALEALESGFLTTKRMKSTVKPRKRESSTKKNRSVKACNRAQLLPDNESEGLEQSKSLDQNEDSKPSFLLNGATTESKALDRGQDSKPVILTEHPKLPPIVWKLSFKRSRGASE